MEEKYLAAEKILKKYGQEHLLSQYDKLDDEKKAKLLDEILTLDFNQINELFKRIGKTEDEKNGEIEPVGCTDKSAMSKEELEAYDNIDPKLKKRQQEEWHVCTRRSTDSDSDSDYPDIDEFEYDEDGHAIFPF